MQCSLTKVWNWLHNKDCANPKMNLCGVNSPYGGVDDDCAVKFRLWTSTNVYACPYVIYCGLTVFLLSSIGLLLSLATESGRQSDDCAYQWTFCSNWKLVISSMKDAETGTAGIYDHTWFQFSLTLHECLHFRLHPCWKRWFPLKRLTRSTFNANGSAIILLCYFAQCPIKSIFMVFSESNQDLISKWELRSTTARWVRPGQRLLPRAWIYSKELLEEAIHKRLFQQYAWSLITGLLCCRDGFFSPAFYFLIGDRRRREYELQLEKSVADLLRSNHNWRDSPT